jgi:peptidoglycan hydrolase CwlO-like protein
MSNVSMIDGHIDGAKLTDNEIIKALWCCAGKYPCGGCPGEKVDCEIEPYALDLINRQKEQINGLIAAQETLQKYLAEKQEQIEKLEKIEHFATKTIDTQQAEIKRLQHKNSELQHEILSCKAEAIKEFAERLKNNMIATHRRKDGFCIYDVNNEQIDNLVKEMVG